MHCLMELARGVVQRNLKPVRHVLKENAQSPVILAGLY